MDRIHRRAFLRQGTQLASLMALGCSGARAEDVAGGGAPGDATGGTGPGGNGGGPHAGGGDGGAAGEGTGTVDACTTTPPDIEGPFFKLDTPERQDIVPPGADGAHLVVHGQVVGPDCEPITDAVLDFWQADDDGAYDAVGDAFRGHQRVDAEGRYELHTIVPGRYLNGPEYRPAHIHVKVYVAGSEVLTTQLYFEGDPFNERDPWFNEETLLRPEVREGGRVAEFDFVVPRRA
jgi:protocatechuate 3,4-dioxygenase beta subunit